ncbi:hypothetical protein QN363_18090, partial [Undibacterium sp. CCC2.1]|uniref:hypothetical protein n=1 Tax=Undibacterium sp. CCC2.1 TaxID=3048604 RepID=UPI002B23484E
CGIFSVKNDAGFPPKACGNDEAVACGNDEAVACGNDEVCGVSGVKNVHQAFATASSESARFCAGTWWRSCLKNWPVSDEGATRWEEIQTPARVCSIVACDDPLSCLCAALVSFPYKTVAS